MSSSPIPTWVNHPDRVGDPSDTHEPGDEVPAVTEVPELVADVMPTDSTHRPTFIASGLVGCPNSVHIAVGALAGELLTLNCTPTELPAGIKIGK
ncbi:MAG: hypothetical protein EP324_08215 [Gammaproteobacteria bacterium]|nr:MAG: hypothetical protein EP324_08215 [Gammaproteobacteria bacterium]